MNLLRSARSVWLWASWTKAIIDRSYDDDVLEWSEQQAQLLLQHVEGKLDKEPPDWPDIIEDVESTGRSQLNAA